MCFHFGPQGTAACRLGCVDFYLHQIPDLCLWSWVTGRYMLALSCVMAGPPTHEPCLTPCAFWERLPHCPVPNWSCTWKLINGWMHFSASESFRSLETKVLGGTVLVNTLKPETLGTQKHDYRCINGTEQSSVGNTPRISLLRFRCSVLALPALPTPPRRLKEQRHRGVRGRTGCWCLKRILTETLRTICFQLWK